MERRTIKKCNLNCVDVTCVELQLQMKMVKDLFFFKKNKPFVLIKQLAAKLGSLNKVSIVTLLFSVR